MDYPKIRIIKKDSSDIEIEEDQLIDLKNFQLEIRSIESTLGGISFFLSPAVDFCNIAEWIIVKDNLGALCLVPLRKKH